MDQATTLRKMMSPRSEEVPFLSPSAAPPTPRRIFVLGDSEVGKTILIDNLVALLREQNEQAFCFNRAIPIGTVKTHADPLENERSPWGFVELSLKDWESPRFEVSPLDIQLWVGRENDFKPETLEWMELAQRQWGFKKLGIIANGMPNGAAALSFFKKIEKNCAKKLAVDLGYLGFCPFDKKINEAMRNGHVLVEWKVDSFASRCLRMILSRLQNWKQDIEVQSRWKVANGGGETWL